MTEPPLVSVITPCFNGEQHVGRLIESILAQTYPRIEFILVNDGSTDCTEKVVMSFRDQLHRCLTRFTYVLQANSGLGGAISAGLQHVHGEYLCWPDADDFLEPDSITERVAVFLRHPEYAVVTSDANIRQGSDLGTVQSRISTAYKHNTEPCQFEHLLRGESIFTPGCHMVRMTSFDETHPDRAIYPARRGQNWQMLLPLYYRHRRYYLDKPLYNYVVYDDSMSRGDETLERLLARAAEHREIQLRTLASMSMSAAERQKYDSLVEVLYQKKVMKAGFRSRDFGVASAAFTQLSATRAFSSRERLRVWGKLVLARLQGGKR